MVTENDASQQPDAGTIPTGVDNRADAIGALVFGAFGGLIIGMAATAPQRELTHDAVGPWAIPVALAIAMIALSLVQAFRSYRLMRKMGRFGPSEGAEDEPGHRVIPIRALAFIAAGLAHPFLIQSLGYLLTTLPLIAIGLWSLEFRRPAPLIIATAGFTGLVYFLFVFVLNVRLPSGILGWP